MPGAAGLSTIISILTNYSMFVLVGVLSVYVCYCIWKQSR